MNLHTYCANCSQPIKEAFFYEVGSPEPDYQREDDICVWRHLSNGYAACGGSRFAKPRPEIVVLCGSTRFYEEFQRANLELTLAGKIVLSIGCVTSSDKDLGFEIPEKMALDELHKRKIDLADSVYVLNKDGYVGDSTRSEIRYARDHDKPVTYLEPYLEPYPEQRVFPFSVGG